MFAARVQPIITSRKCLSNRNTLIRMMTASTVPVDTLVNSEVARKLHGQAVFVDGSYHMNARSGREEYAKERIVGARYFDINSVCAKDTELPHMMPSAAQWTEAMDEFGIDRDDHVIVYTHKDAMSAPRVWYLFKAFGHAKVSILNGGIEAWRKSGGAIETDETKIPSFRKAAGGYQGATLNRQMVASVDDVKTAMETGIAQILDARSEARFRGTADEPREGLVSGCIPGSLSLPYTELCENGDSTTFVSKEEIRDKFKESGIIFGSKIISSCGSGITACYSLVGMNLIGKSLEDMPIYDGSWTEWGNADNTLPKRTKDDW